MQCPMTSLSAFLTSSGLGSVSWHRILASRAAILWAAAIKKCPLPQAGSQTLIDNNSCSGFSALHFSLIIGSKAESRRQVIKLVGV